MGVIKRQSIKNSIINYIGVCIGAFNVLFIYSYSLEQYGVAQWFISTSLLLMPFVLFGMNSLVVKFFPTFQNEEGTHNGFLGLLLLGSLTGILLFTLLFFLFYPLSISAYTDKPYIKNAFFLLVPLVCFRGIYELFVQYVSNFKRIVVPAILNQLIKITLPILILLYVNELIPSIFIMYGVVATYLLSLLCMVFYTYSLGQLSLRPKFSFLTNPMLKEMATYAGFGILGLLGTHLALRIDTFMVGTLIGESEVGRYNIVLFIIGVIEIPILAIMKITAPIVSDAWQRNDLGHIDSLYKKTSINLLIIGVLLMLLIWSSLNDILSLMPNTEELLLVKNVVLFIGVAKLVDMATSINNQIIGYSTYYRFNFYAVLCMAAFNIFSNLIFIPIYQEVGASIATLVSICLYNLLKFSYVYYRFQMIPFTWNTLWVLLVGAIIYLTITVLPYTSSVFINIVLRSALILILFGGTIYYFNISTDINETVNDWLEKGKGWLHKARNWKH